MPADHADSSDARDPAAAAGDDRLAGIPHGVDFARTRTDLAEFRAGDLHAFERLWLRYEGALEVMIAGRIRRIGPALRARLDAELDDILQEAALTVHAKLHEFEYRGPGSILAWMAKIGAHVVGDRIDYWRAGRRRPQREQPLAGIITSVPIPRAVADALRHQGPGPATEHGQRQARRAVAAELAKLSEREHTIVLWRFFGGATWAEIAAGVGAPSGEAVRKEWSDRILPSFAASLAKSARGSTS